MYSNKNIIQKVRESQDVIQNVTKESNCITNVRNNLTEGVVAAGAGAGRKKTSSFFFISVFQKFDRGILLMLVKLENVFNAISKYILKYSKDGRASYNMFLVTKKETCFLDSASLFLENKLGSPFFFLIFRKYLFIKEK